jgi:hypothetical protein
LRICAANIFSESVSERAERWRPLTFETATLKYDPAFGAGCGRDLLKDAGLPDAGLTSKEENSPEPLLRFSKSCQQP